MQKKSLAVRIFGSHVVTRQNGNTPRDEEWDQYLFQMTQLLQQRSGLSILVFTDGGSPDAAQRKRMKDSLGGTTVPVSIVSESVAVRFVVSSLALLNREIRSFSPNELTKAFDHLNLDESARKETQRALEEMSSELDPNAGK